MIQVVKGQIEKPKKGEKQEGKSLIESRIGGKGVVNRLGGGG